MTCAATATRDVKASDRVVPEPIRRLFRGRMEPCALTTKGNVFCPDGEAYKKVEGVADLVEVDGGSAGACGANSKNAVTCWGGVGGDDPPWWVTMTY